MLDTRPPPSSDQAWRLWLALWILVLVALGACGVWFFRDRTATEERAAQPAYVPVAIAVGAQGPVIVKGRFNLQVAASQQAAFQPFVPKLTILANKTVLEYYQAVKRPRISEIQHRLYQVLNRALPDTLAIQDVLVDSLVYER